MVWHYAELNEMPEKLYNQFNYFHDEIYIIDMGYRPDREQALANLRNDVLAALDEFSK